jgi:hypothetical protein
VIDDWGFEVRDLLGTEYPFLQPRFALILLICVEYSTVIGFLFFSITLLVFKSAPIVNKLDIPLFLLVPLTDIHALVFR